jgi:hypothetical protein
MREFSSFDIGPDPILSARLLCNVWCSFPGRIQMSESTALLLMKANKGHWLKKREDKVDAKGKGELQTYWLEISGKTETDSVVGSSNSSSSESEESTDSDEISLGDVFREKSKYKQLSARKARLVDWLAECMSQVLRQVVARREGRRKYSNKSEEVNFSDAPKMTSSVFREVREVIELPKCQDGFDALPTDPETVCLGEPVQEQLQEFIAAISLLYDRKLPFHCFEHASHVVMCVRKLSSRIVSPSDILSQSGERRARRASKLHDHTYGITSDPIILFACLVAGT